MTSENLIEEAAKAIFFRGDPVDPRQWGHMQDGMRIVAREQARAAIQVIAPAVLEQAAEEIIRRCYVVGVGAKDTNYILKALFPTNPKALFPTNPKDQANG